MQAIYKRVMPVILLTLALVAPATRVFAQIDLWLTDPDKPVLFEKQKESLVFGKAANVTPNTNSAGNENQIIDVSESQTFQTIDGFGCCLTGGSAAHLMGMDAILRAALLKELFATGSTNIGISYLRVSIGASDLNDQVFSYDDLPAGETDPDMKKFSLGPDRADVIPVLKQILAITPDIKILG